MGKPRANPFHSLQLQPLHLQPRDKELKKNLVETLGAQQILQNLQSARLVLISLPRSITPSVSAPKSHQH